MISMEDLAQYVAAQDMADKVAREREAFIRGEGSEYAQGGGVSVIPSANGDVPVSYQEPGLEEPMIDPADLVAGGLVGAIAKGGSGGTVGKLAREFTEGNANFPRFTQVGQSSGGSLGQAVVDGNPYTRTELVDSLARMNSAKSGKGSGWVVDSFPYTRDGSYLDRDIRRAFGTDTGMKMYQNSEISPELQSRMIDVIRNDM